MQVLGLLGVVAFSLASAVVGVRLLRLAARTRQVPELAMGLAFVVSGAIGFPLLSAASIAMQTGGADPSRWVMGFGTLSLFSGYVGLGVGCWRIYRPVDRWPLWPIGAGAVLLLAASAVTFASREFGPGSLRDVAFWSGVAIGSATFAWNALESFLLYAQLRRRLVFGLTEPEVVNRVLLWGIGSFAAFVMTLHGLATRIFIGHVIDDAHRLVSSACGLVAAVAIGLAFFPPAAYRRRITAPPARPRSL